MSEYSLQIIATIILSISGSILGRMGGSDKFNTKWRDVGVSIVTCMLVGIWGGFHWTLILCCGLMFASMTTYFKKKGEPVRWYNWLICGLAYSVALVPYIWAQGLWVGFGARSLILPLVIMGWCVLIGNSVVEELGRYALILLTVPLLFIKRRK